MGQPQLYSDAMTTENNLKILPQKRKSFLNLKSQMQSVRTKLLLEKINDFLNEENKGCDTPISMTQLLGYLIHRVNYATDKKTASIGMNIYKQEHTQKQQFTNRDAVALMHDLTLTKAQMRTMKPYLADKGVFFPNSNE